MRHDWGLLLLLLVAAVWAEPAAEVKQLCADARAAKREGRLTEATDLARQAVAKDADCLDGHWLLAWLLVAQDQSADAVKPFREVLRLAKPDSNEAKEAQAALQRLGAAATPAAPAPAATPSTLAWGPARTLPEVRGVTWSPDGTWALLETGKLRLWTVGQALDQAPVVKSFMPGSMRIMPDNRTYVFTENKRKWQVGDRDRTVTTPVRDAGTNDAFSYPLAEATPWLAFHDDHLNLFTVRGGAAPRVQMLISGDRVQATTTADGRWIVVAPGAGSKYPVQFTTADGKRHTIDEAAQHQRLVRVADWAVCPLPRLRDWYLYTDGPRQTCQISPDGQQVLYLGDDGAYLARTDGTQARLVVPYRTAPTLTGSFGHQWDQATGHATVLANGTLWRVDPRTAQVTQLAGSLGDWALPSPTGEWLLVDRLDGQRRQPLGIRVADGRQVTIAGTNCRWLGDGRVLCLTGDRETRTWVIQDPAGKRQPVVLGPAANLEPAPSPDGRLLMLKLGQPAPGKFVCDRVQVLELASGKLLEPVTVMPAGFNSLYGPAWRPSSDGITCCSVNWDWRAKLTREQYQALKWQAVYQPLTR